MLTHKVKTGISRDPTLENSEWRLSKGKCRMVEMTERRYPG